MRNTFIKSSWIVKKYLVKTVLLETKISGGPNLADEMSKVIKVDMIEKKKFQSQK